MGTELIWKGDLETFHYPSTREVKVEGRDSGTITITITTRWGKTEDAARITVLPEELELINKVVNGDTRDLLTDAQREQIAEIEAKVESDKFKELFKRCLSDD